MNFDVSYFFENRIKNLITVQNDNFPMKSLLEKYKSITAFRTPTFYPHFLSSWETWPFAYYYYCFYFSFKKKNELLCLILSDTKHMLSPFNIETTFRRAKFFKAYILQSDQHVRHASTPFVRKKRKQTKNVLKIIHFSNYYFSWQAL